MNKALIIIITLHKYVLLQFKYIIIVEQINYFILK